MQMSKTTRAPNLDSNFRVPDQREVGGGRKAIRYDVEAQGTSACCWDADEDKPLDIK